ncbi:MAG: hypothetical protein N2319_01840 [Candidatus Kapabacteria bacterium]|nr:hypothetical protein [Candidatus Kapabacteria bacterium]
MKKTIISTIILLIFILLNSCGTVEPTSNNNISILEGLNILDTLNSKFRELAEKTGSGPINTLMKTKEWLAELPNVSGASILDDYFMIIQLKSGLSVTFNLVLVDAEGYSIFRGGGGEAESIAMEKFNELQKREIPNKKVLFYSAAYSEFYKKGELEKTLSHFEKSKEKYEVTVLKDQDCKPEIIETFGNYGLVIIDTHGEPDAFMTGGKITLLSQAKSEEDIKAVFKKNFGSEENYYKILNKELRLGASIRWEIDTTKPGWLKDFSSGELYATSKLIINLPKLSNTIIFGNCCYSGYGVKPPDKYSELSIRTAFLKTDPISYYGYSLNNDRSTVVTDQFSKSMEDSLVKSFVVDLDTTKQANLTYDNLEFYDQHLYQYDLDRGNKNPDKLWFRHYNHNDYWFGGCITEFTDERDGQKYKAVCIGKQNWMAENLRYNAQGSVIYNNNNAFLPLYGRLYDWNTMMNGESGSSSNPSGRKGICPKGWHIPSKAEWEELLKFVGYDTGKLKDTIRWKTPNSGHTNLYRFTALPGGIQTPPPTSAFSWFSNAGFWWSTDVSTTLAETHRIIFNIVADNNVGSLEDAQMQSKASCRCVKD